MKTLVEYKENIHSCSKCGLCQSVCPLYKVTGNDCTVSRGLFIMLKNLIKGNIKMSKNLNKYLDLCLKCGACSKFCPSGIDVVEIITSAKAEYFKQHPIHKVISFLERIFVFGLGTNLLKIFSKNIKSKKFSKTVIYFGGCGSKITGNRAVINLLNACGIEVITPNFECCGISFYIKGDKDTYEYYKKSFANIIKQYNVTDIVTTCASCEKTLKSYNIEGLKIKNIYEYIRENNLSLKLKKRIKVTFHKPCNIENYDDIKWILNNTKNLEYIEMKDFDSCCGLNGISKVKQYKIMSKIYKNKRKNILDTGAKFVLTSCLGCEFALKFYSLGQYKVLDFTDFLGQYANINSDLNN